MTCLQCANLDLREHPKHAQVGVGRCKYTPLPGVFASISKERQCEQFAAADEEIVQKRVEWWNNKKGG